MNQYTDIHVIECNRLHSEEAKSGNNENYALWTNNLQDIVHLNPGDKISIQSAMISERGAGSGANIEIKGESLGIKKTFSITTLTTHTTDPNVAKLRIDNSDEIRLTYGLETKEIFDNKGYFTINYFIPANGHNYIDLPRRFWFSEFNNDDNIPNHVNYVAADSQSAGMSYADPFGMLDTGLPASYTYPDRWDFYDDYYQIVGKTANASLSKLRKDNSRYTIMIREKTYNSSLSMYPNRNDEYKVPPHYLREPEFHTYHTYQELKEITAPVGFSSPDFLSTEITRQLQNVEKTNLFNLTSGVNDTDNPYTPGFKIPITKSISTETYKPFNVARDMGETFNTTPTEQEKLMLKFVNASTNLTDGWDYLNQYHLIACKRPELYEYGRLINRKEDLGIALTRGSLLASSTNGHDYVLKIPYDNLTLLNDFRGFIQAQEKYPEIFNIFSDSRTPYVSGDTIDNCRWLHINRFENASMTMYNGSDTGIIKNTATLGWGGYTFPTWNASKVSMKSIILPFDYDPNQRDTYYTYPDESKGERTYGCFGRSSSGYIKIYGTFFNGSGSPLLSTLYNASGYIEVNRKIGFDQHFSAPGMAYLLPCDIRPEAHDIIDTNTHSDNEMTNGGDINNLNYSTVDTYMIPPAQLYLGANSPKLNWNGANFTLSDLHTSMNQGNNFLAGNSTATTVANYNYSRNSDTESNVVYKINPREDYCDFSPARKPYVGNIQLSGYSAPAKEINTSRMNSNLEAWRIYDSLTGILITDFGIDEKYWENSFWGLLGFSYNQFHSSTNTRLSVINNTNVNDLSIITTNSDINEGDNKIYTQNMYGVPLFYNRLPYGGTFLNKDDALAVRYLPEIIQKTQSIELIADNLPTRMIRGYYTIRSNILQNTPFIGGKVNNTTMPICGIVSKINNYGDFVFGEESSLVFTITKPLKLASLTCSIHDPDGSYARCSEQSTVLFKIQKNMNITFDVIQEILQEQQQQKNR
jgi:hypothetical protein